VDSFPILKALAKGINFKPQKVVTITVFTLQKCKDLFQKILFATIINTLDKYDTELFIILFLLSINILYNIYLN
jgi:hypothetical protein